VTFLGPDDLSLRFAQEHGAVTALARVAPRIVRWAWTTPASFLPEVLPGAEKALAEMRWLEGPQPGRYDEYGFDDQQRIVLARSIVTEEGRASTEDQLTVTYDGERSWGVHYSIRRDPDIPVAIWTSLTVSGRVIAHEVRHHHAGHYEAHHFEWRDSRPHSRTTSRADGSQTTLTFEPDDDAEHGEDADPATLVTLLARDVSTALHDVPIDGRRLIWISYPGDGDAWLDAAWPSLAVAFETDLPSLRKAVRADNWRSGWDLNRWSIAERDVELLTDTQQALETNAVPVSDVDHVLREVAATLARADTHGDCIYIAIDDELEQLDGAVGSLPELQVHRLRLLGLVLPVGRSHL